MNRRISLERLISVSLEWLANPSYLLFILRWCYLYAYLSIISIKHLANTVPVSSWCWSVKALVVITGLLYSPNTPNTPNIDEAPKFVDFLTGSMGFVILRWKSLGGHPQMAMNSFFTSEC